MTTRTFLSLFCLFSLFYLFGCNSFSSRPNRELRISFNATPASFDPGTCGDLVSSSLSYLLYEGLVRSFQGKPEPALAEKIEISEDLLTYTFHLKPSVWSDGKALTAHDFERSWKRVLNPKFPAVWPHLFFPIKNAEKLYRGEISSNEIGIEVLNDLTLRVTLERPAPYFLTLMTFPCYFPTPDSKEIKLSDAIVNNGPFSIEKATPHAEILLKKNPNFWNSEQIFLEKVNISIIPCEETALKMFECGELDLIGGMESPLPLDSLESLRKKYLFSFSPIPATTFCSFNTKHPFLQNKNLRKALSYAIDRSSVIKNITQMNETIATRPIPPVLIQVARANSQISDSLDLNREFYPSFDPQEAQALLKRALAELAIEKEQLNNLVFSYSSSEINRKIASALCEQWKETLGISVHQECCEKQGLREKLFKGTYDLALYFWISQFEDPIAILERFQDPKNLKNTPHWYSEEYCNLLLIASEEKNPLLRLRILEAAEELFCEEMPLAPIYHWSNGWICSKSLHQVVSMPSGLIQYEWISKDSSP